MFGVDIFSLNQSAPTPRKATRLREVKSEDVGGLGWAGIGADGEEKVGGRQRLEGNCTKPRMICLFYHRLFSRAILSKVRAHSLRNHLYHPWYACQILHFALKIRIVTLI